MKTSTNYITMKKEKYVHRPLSLDKAVHVSLTADYWSSVAHDSYLGVTAITLRLTAILLNKLIAQLIAINFVDLSASLYKKVRYVFDQG